MNISLTFSLLSGAFILLAYIAYNRDIFLDTSKPSATSWGLWTIITVLNLASYFVMTKDLLKNSLPIIASTACLITFIFLLGKKNYTPFSRTDISIFFIGFISILGWWWFQSAVFANMLLQLANFIAFIPTYKSVWSNPANEKPFPWILFSFAYAFLFITVFLRFNGNIADFVFPLLALVLHSIVVFLIIFRQKLLKNSDIKI